MDLKLRFLFGALHSSWIRSVQSTYKREITNVWIVYLQQVLDRGSPCWQQQGEGPGRIHSAGEGAGKDSREEQVEVGHIHSSFQVKDSRKRQHRSGRAQHEKLKTAREKCLSQQIHQTV